jgi:2-oxoglutarate ferredoxin oxidoreductase subunit delta
MTEKAADKTAKQKVKTPAQITIFEAWCKRCGICAAFCPGKVYDRDTSGKPLVTRPEDCIRCRMCELRCPDFAITVEEPSKDQK